MIQHTKVIGYAPNRYATPRTHGMWTIFCPSSTFFALLFASLTTEQRLLNPLLRDNNSATTTGVVILVREPYDVISRLNFPDTLSYVTKLTLK